MASVIDAIRTVFGAKHSLLKLLTITLIVTYPVYRVLLEYENPLDLWPIITYVALVFYLGFMMLSSYNLINEKVNLLPGFLNPFKLFFAGIGGVLAIGPMAALMVYVGYCLQQIAVQHEVSLIAAGVLIFFVELLLWGILVVQMTLYTTDFNPIKAYHLIKILLSFLTFALKTIPLLLLLGLITAFLLYPMGYLSYKIFGLDSFGFIFTVAIFISLLIIVSVQYYSQMAMESLVLGKNEDDESAGDILDKQLLVDNDK